MSDLIERFRTLLADADADYAADLEDAEITGERPDLDDRQIELPVEWVREAADRIAALEAEASERERRGLEAHAEAAFASVRAYLEGQAPSTCSGGIRNSDLRALIPEAPAQRELGSLETNQISTPEVGLPEAPAEGWQPISSAPKDGTEIILHDRGTVGTGFYSEAPEARRGEAGWFWEDDRGNLVIAKNADPTHWMPLPPPPPQEREG